MAIVRSLWIKMNYMLCKSKIYNIYYILNIKYLTNITDISLKV